MRLRGKKLGQFDAIPVLIFVLVVIVSIVFVSFKDGLAWAGVLAIPTVVFVLVVLYDDRVQAESESAAEEVDRATKDKTEGV
jgi:hypothetical protein